MALLNRSCAVLKCQIASCATCHCCQADLCLNHLKEHKDQLNEKLYPLANQVNVYLDDLNHFDPSTTPSFIHLEQWRLAAHETIDRYCQHMQTKLHEQAKDKPLEKLLTTRDLLNQFIQSQGATREIIDSLTNEIQSIQQEIEQLRNIPINLRPLVIDNNISIDSKVLNKGKQRVQNNQASSQEQDDATALSHGFAFQIFITTQFGRQLLLAVKPSDKILDLKHKITARMNIPSDQQRLSYLGKILKDDFNIATYGIHQHATVNLFLQCISQDSATQS